MEQITQKDFIKRIEEKKANAEMAHKRAVYHNEGTNRIKTIAYVEVYENIIQDLNEVEIVPKHNAELDALQYAVKGLNEQHSKAEQDKKLLEPLCNKCIRTNETCPFHRIGSAYGDCSGFIEQKPQEIRNDRIREFETESGNKFYIDAKEIACIKLYDDGDISMWLIYNSFVVNEKKYDYNDLIEWWKYWKQN